MGAVLVSGKGTWSSKLLRVLFRPRIVHDIPGRVRIQLPFLKRVPPERRDVVDAVVALIRVPDEIHAVERHAASDRVLVHYDPDRASARDVLGFMNALFEIYLRNRAVLDAVPADRWPEVEPRLIELVGGAVRHPLALDPDLEIETDVLA